MNGGRKVLLDTDVILDLLTGRQPHSKYAASLFRKIKTGEVRAYSSPVSMTDLFYILRQELPHETTVHKMQKLQKLVSVLPVNETILDVALSSRFNDLEDAIQYYSAVFNNINTLITRNSKEYNYSQLSILSPEEFLHSFAR